GGQRRVSVGPRPLAYDEHPDSSFSEFDRSAQPGSSGPNHQDGGGDLLFSASHVPLLMWLLPVGTDSGPPTHPNNSVGVAAPGTRGDGLRTTTTDFQGFGSRSQPRV